MKGLDDGPDGLNDAAFDAALEAPAKAKRKKGKSPTARTLDECRKRGWIAQNVERPWNKFSKVKLDLFGVIDLVAIVPPALNSRGQVDARGAILGIQACSGGRSGEGGRGSDHAARRDKILAEPRAKAWIDAGGRLELWSWSARGAKGKRKLWTLRVETYEEMRASAGFRIGMEVVNDDGVVLDPIEASEAFR